MMVSMDDQIEPINNDVFSFGDVVKCKTCRGEQIVGQVLLFEDTYRILALSKSFNFTLIRNVCTVRSIHGQAGLAWGVEDQNFE